MVGKNLYKSLIVLMVFALVLQGCSQRVETATPVTAPVTISEAPVSAVEALRLDADPPDVRLLVSGSLPDSCTRLGEVEMERQNSLFRLTLPASRTAGSDCGEPVAYERLIRLPVEGLAPGKYSVLINGRLSAFEIPPKAAVQLASVGTAPQATETPSTAEEAAPEPTAISPVTGAVEQPDCVNKAGFFGEVLTPDGTILDPRTEFVKSWKVRNEGTCYWQGYQLVFLQGDNLGSASSYPLPEAEPGQIIEIAVPMTAPSAPGGYHGEWQFADASGQTFGMGSAGTYPLTARVGVRTRVPPPPVDPDCAVERNPEIEAEILRMINEARAQYGLPAYSVVELLSEVARNHSLDMACNNFIEHYGSNGLLYTGRLQAASVPYQTATENIYSGNGGPAGAFKWWMNSQIHRDAILSSKFTEIGIGYVKRAPNKYQEYFTVVFIRP